MKHLLQFLLLAGIIFAATFGINYLFIQADPTMNFDGVREPVAYGSMMFAILISGAILLYQPPKIKFTR